MHSTVILLAAGSGSRMMGSVADKVLEPLAGYPTITHSARSFVKSGIVNHFTVVYRDEAQIKELQSALQLVENFPTENTLWVRGGKERQQSVLNALQAQSNDCDFVFIHDGARPLVSVKSIRELDQAARSTGAAVLAYRVTDTIKRTVDRADRMIPQLEDLDRSRLWAMETPQVFKYSAIKEAYQSVSRAGKQITDDVAAAQLMDLPVKIVENQNPNPKLTKPSDIAYVEWLLSRENGP